MPTNPMIVPVASFCVANAAAAVVSVQTQEASFSAIIGSVTVAITATCTMVIFVSPLIAKAIREGLPPIVGALAEIRHQREELSKGSYTEQIDDLKGLMADLKADNAKLKSNQEESEKIHAERAALAAEQAASAAERVEAANKKLHEIRNKLGADILSRDALIIELENEIKALRLEVQRAVPLQAARADAQDRRIAANRADIAELRSRTPDPDLEPAPNPVAIAIAVATPKAPD